MKAVGAPLLTIEQIREIDQRAQTAYGIPELVLMEGAGLLAWQAIRDRLQWDGVLAVVAGRGNNGADALVLARYASIEGFAVVVVISATPHAATPAALHLRSVRQLGVQTVAFEESPEEAERVLSSAGLIVDGLLGSGASGAIRAPIDQLVELVNRSSSDVVSLDLPSGLSSTWRPGESIVKATYTLELGAAKSVCYSPPARGHCGVIEQVAIGFPTALLDEVCHGSRIYTLDDLPRVLAPVSEAAHKGVRGRVEVVGGSPGMTGAPLLAAYSALRSRAGLVRIVADGSLLPSIESRSLSVMSRSVAEASAPWETLVIGPGWGRSHDRSELLQALLASPSSGVIDADGIHALAAMLHDGDLGERPSTPKTGSLREGSWVVTPHPGELRALAEAMEIECEPASEFECAATIAQMLGVVVVAKGAATCIVTPGGRRALVDGLNAALATAGSGDVLAGAIGGLMASGCEPFEAALSAVLAHQEAGKRVRAREGFFTAEELPSAIGEVLDGRP